MNKSTNIKKLKGNRYTGDGLWPITSAEVLSSGYFECYSIEDLRLMRNDIYARHGYIFKDKSLRKIFGKQPWYKPTTSNASSLKLSEIEQINILPSGDMEVVPRVGNHVVKVGRIPQFKDKERREKEIEKFLSNKFQRLKKFYVYGLNKIGWNKYKYINIEFDNQIICKKNGNSKDDDLLQDEAMKAEEKGDKEKENATEKESDTKKVKEQEKTTEKKP